MEQTQQYIKQFPELFAGKKILYVHGFASSGQSGTVSRIRQVLPQAEVIAPDLPLHPDEALTLLNNTCAKEQPHLIIGTSMGGMYAEMLRGYDRILVNPALQMGDTMKDHGMMGAQTFQNPRQDGVQEFIVTKALVKEYKEMTEHCFEGLTDDDRSHVVGLFGDEDDLVHTLDLFQSHYPQQAIRFHGEHRMNDRSFMHSVVPVIRWIDDRQEGRERPIVYVATNTLIAPPHKEGAECQPTASAQKAVRWLIEHYQVFFVAPALSGQPQQYAETTAWLYQYINVPAHNHTLFTPQPQLLYGDYLISSERIDGMATLIHYGSDTFKTWDAILEYFERLGGQ